MKTLVVIFLNPFSWISFFILFLILKQVMEQVRKWQVASAYAKSMKAKMGENWRDHGVQEEYRKNQEASVVKEVKVEAPPSQDNALDSLFDRK